MAVTSAVQMIFSMKSVPLSQALHPHCYLPSTRSVLFCQVSPAACELLGLQARKLLAQALLAISAVCGKGWEMLCGSRYDAQPFLPNFPQAWGIPRLYPQGQGCIHPEVHQLGICRYSTVGLSHSFLTCLFLEQIEGPIASITRYGLFSILACHQL